MKRALFHTTFGLVVLFLFFPILVIIPLSFSTSDFLRFPPRDLGFRWYHVYFNDPVWMEATWRSFRVALSAGLLATVTGTMAVLWISRTRNRAAGLVTGLFMAPAIVPNIVIALGLFVLALALGVTGREWVLVLGHAALGLPFVVLIVGAAARQVDPDLERAARVMGAGPVRAFRHATLPKLVPAIAAAGIFSFFISFDELIIALFTSGGSPTIPVRIWTDLRFEINPTVAAVASVLVVFTTAMMIVAELLRRKQA